LKTWLQGFIVFLYSIMPVLAAPEIESKPSVNTVSYAHIVNWSLGLIVVLILFFACVWFMKKMGALPVNAKDGMKVVSGLSLGMREKLVLVQVGEKQLLLGITPGRIEKLMELEAQDTLFQQTKVDHAGAEFSDKFKQVLSGASDE